MTLYHPRVLANKLEALVPELQRWSHRAGIALQNAQIQQNRIEERLLQTSQSVQIQEQQLALNQECVQQAEVLLQAYARKCQEALGEAQQTASATKSILNEARTTYDRKLQALQRARAALTQAEQALRHASADTESKNVESANASGVEGDRQAADGRLSVAKEAQRQASSAARDASAQAANGEKAVASASQALQLAEVAYQHAQAGLKASEDSIEFVRAASRALDVGKQELSKEEAVVRATSEALQHATLLTQESSNQVSAARSYEQPAQLHTSDALRILQEKIGLLIFMNRPELEISSDPIMALLQLDAVADTGELTQILNPTLERLLIKLDGIDDLKPYRWNNLNQEERLEVLQNAHNAVAAIYRFAPSIVELKRLLPTRRGEFSPRTKYIAVNVKLVAGNDNVQPLQTLLHESRHAYQWHLVKHFRRGFGWHSNTDWTLAQEWSDNWDDYKQPEQNSFKDYYDQPIEVDARNFAETVIKLLFGK